VCGTCGEQDGFVENVADVVTVGQEVDVRVLNVDLSSGKVGLSMKSEEAAA